MSPLFLAVSYFFHLVATIVWVGGLVMMVVLVWPEVSRALAEKPELYALLTRLRKRFVPWTNLSLAVLVMTGFVQMSADPNYKGFLQFSNDWSKAILLKHIAVIGMVACGMFLQLGVSPALERATLLLERGKGDPAEWQRLRRQEVRLTWLNAALGILVLAFTAWATAQ